MGFTDMNSLDQSQELDAFEVGSGILAILAGLFLLVAFIEPTAQTDWPFMNLMPIISPVFALAVALIFHYRSN